MLVLGIKKNFSIIFSLHEKVTVDRKALSIQKRGNGKIIVIKEPFNNCERMESVLIVLLGGDSLYLSYPNP